MKDGNGFCVKNTSEPAEESLTVIRTARLSRNDIIKVGHLRSIWVVSRKFAFRPIVYGMMGFLFFHPLFAPCPVHNIFVSRLMGIHLG